MFRLAIVGLIITMLLVWVIAKGIKALVDRRHHRELARYAPRLLGHHGVPQPVVEMIVAQAKQLEDAAHIMNGTLHDDEYYSGADDMEAWLRKNKAIQRRLDA